MNLTPLGDFNFSLRGECPHDGDRSVFTIVGQPFIEAVSPTVYRVVVAMRCQGCLKYILGIASRHGETWEYETHYPLGSPDDSVPVEVSEVDESIASDFSEARRCFWVNSYKATVAMCRRSVEAACKQQGATGRDLEKKIDNLAEQGKITDSLRQMAHAVRLSGNRGLHGKRIVAPKDDDAPPTDDLDMFGEDEAKAMIAFVEQFFQHLYVMPALLEKYKPKPKGEASEGS